MILSHHGELEFGSPKVPLFPEALLLHHLDNLDSKMECIRVMVEKDRQQERCWTTYNASLDRSVLKKLKYLDEHGNGSRQPAAVPPAAASAPPPPRPAPPPRTSFFGDRLKQALGGLGEPG